MSRTEVRELLVKYERAVEDDAAGLLRPTDAEIKFVGRELLGARAEAVRRARDANRRFVEAAIDDLPDLCAGPFAAKAPVRPVAQFRELPSGVSTLPASSYGSMASVFLHLFRDWSSDCEHVLDSTYRPAIAKLKELLPRPGAEVLVPGCGLARLALMLAGEGYKVEANEGSRLFLTFADYLLNRAPVEGQKVHPLAHVFSENWGHEQQYIEINVPSPPPTAPLGGGSASGAAAPGGGADGGGAAGAAGPPLVLVPGDFAKTYRYGGPGHRRFDAVVTCFFLDTATDVVELVEVLDGLLADGGIWVNIGPLNWRSETRLKLCWSEVTSIFKSLGYDFVSTERAECDYHLRRGLKMYTESYTCSLTAAVKRTSKAEAS